MPRIYQRVVSLNEVKITRNGDTASIDYIDPAEEGGTILKIGPGLATMSDLDVVEMYNDMVLAIKEHQAEHPYVAIEIPKGKPQIEYSKQCSQWSARGDILRCGIESSENSGHVPVIRIDGQRLSWMEFGALISSHEGWGMRIMFVPDNETDKTPAIVIQESSEDHLELSRLTTIKPQGSC
jgi:hypothetical protein